MTSLVDFVRSLGNAGAVANAVRSLGNAGAVANAKVLLDQHRRDEWLADTLARRVDVAPAPRRSRPAA